MLQQKNKIYKLYQQKLIDIENSNITNLDKKILAKEYKKLMENIIYINKDNSIVPLTNINYISKSYSNSITEH